VGAPVPTLAISTVPAGAPSDYKTTVPHVLEIEEGPMASAAATVAAEVSDSEPDRQTLLRKGMAERGRRGAAIPGCPLACEVE